ncbi:interferon-inducible GTPase 5-like isoform X1 [Trachemys scripta elegans]|uniref:interferon-inducible GTPase 5-like isoform X1 n=1 Tax=Trachemys scripta elegans TaxID=31138 RepID=UPI001554C5EE|nr:interferon-inducible GTPase 5-like isoform X1 [Trachemys scripta elegans]
MSTEDFLVRPAVPLPGAAMAGKLSREELEKLKAAYETGNLNGAAAKLKEELESLEKIPLDIAITGESGSGKSSFVNAIRGLGDEDEGAAKTGVVETTKDPKGYPHPVLPNVTVWDLPGIGTPNFQPGSYLKQVNFSRYDFFIIIASERFTSHHITLAREIHKMGKRFYYVRSKVDADLYAAQTRRPSTYDEVRILQEIRDNCVKNLRDAGEVSPRVFLICSWNWDKYDFPLLQETLENELDAQKRRAFILGLPNISAKILEKKKAELKKHIWKLALVSCAIAVIPLPGLSFACDVAILMVNMKLYLTAFGLDDNSLTRLAKQVGKPVAELKSVIKTVPMANSISKEWVVSFLSKSACAAVMTAEEALDLIPIIGPFLSGGVSFGTTYYMLNSFLNDAVKDAQNVLAKALS